MPLWFIFSILSVIVLAGSEISQKVSLTQKVNISAITNNFYVWTLQGIIGIFFALILGQFSFNIKVNFLIKLFAIGLVYFAGGTAFYTSYKGNSPSISIVLGTISVIFSSILGSIFLYDRFTALKIIGIALILSSIVFLNFSKIKKFDKYNLYAMIGGMCYGIAYTIDKSFVTTISPFMYLGMMCLMVALVSLIFGVKQIIKESKALYAKNLMPIFSSGIFGSAFNLLTFYAYTNGANVGIADAINNTSVFGVILLEIILLKDKTQISRKIIAAIIAFLGILSLGFSNKY